MLTLASWNMNRNRAAWDHLPELRRRHGIDVFLLQEAPRPTEVPPGFTVHPDPTDPALWKMLPHRPFCSAVATANTQQRVAALRPVPLAKAKVDWGEFVASHPGQFSAVSLDVPGGGVVIVVSLYGIWDKLPKNGELFADATLHRAISDLTVVFAEPGTDKVVVGGDLNVWHAYEGAGERWAGRFSTVFDRLAALGLPLLGPFRPDGVPPLAGCPCASPACRHVDTYRHGRSQEATPYQNDFLFATSAMKCLLGDGGCFVCPDEDIWSYSDHRPVVAEFAVGTP